MMASIHFSELMLQVNYHDVSSKLWKKIAVYRILLLSMRKIFKFLPKNNYVNSMKDDGFGI